MTAQLIKIDSEAQWLDLRRQDITSTAASALFDMSPYMTKFELYHAKKDGVELEFEANERMQKGSRVEQYAAEEVGIKLGMEVRPFKDYMRKPEHRMGSSFDYEIKCPERGWGILEIKAVDYFRFKDGWDDEAPAHIEVQLQHQLECADRHSWGIIAAFTGIYDFHIFERERDRDFGAAIVAKVDEFWADVDAGREPSPDFSRDGDIIKLLYKDATDEKADRTDDGEFESLLVKMEAAKMEQKEISAQIDALKSQLFYMLGNDGGAYTKNYIFDAGMTKGSEGKLITPEMVGQRIGSRSGYRKCLIKNLKGKTND